MSIDIDRLKVDAGYWKENGAPDDATHCAVHDPGKTWFKIGEGGRPMMWHMRFSEWREGLCKESRLVDLIPRPVRTEDAEPMDDNCPAARIGELGNQAHNLGCDYQNDEDISDELGQVAVTLWDLAKKVASLDQAQREREEIIIDALRHVDDPRDDEVHPRQYFMDALHTLYDAGMLRRAGE